MRQVLQGTSGKSQDAYKLKIISTSQYFEVQSDSLMNSFYESSSHLDSNDLHSDPYFLFCFFLSDLPSARVEPCLSGVCLSSLSNK